MRRTLLILTLGLSALACSGGEDDDDKQALFDLPQILPDISPQCLSYMPTTVGSTVTRPIQYRNDGKQQLVIESATLEGNPRGYLSLDGIIPMEVNSLESAAAQYRYTPAAEGWDFATVVVRSNAQNFPVHRLFILALARPENAPMDWDPGPKPIEAGTGMDEACPPMN